jgi:hypothetical protein
MDSRAVADALNTDPKTLRRFLRDPGTSFTPVGSGGRYSFTPDDLKVIRREFTPWHRVQVDKASEKPAQNPAATSARGRRKGMTDAERDALVWAEEPPIELADLRDPRVRAHVRERARRSENLLIAKLMAAGLHVSQRDRAAV